jgi:hypothetical protein
VGRSWPWIRGTCTRISMAYKDTGFPLLDSLKIVITVRSEILEPLNYEFSLVCV